jgi:hypothetical protein
MKTNKEYREQVEKRHGKPLREIMHELIVERHMDQWSGSEELGVPKETFVKWRTKFRLGPVQRRADSWERKTIDTLNEYRKELRDIDVGRPLTYREETSLRGFREIIERMVEVEKVRSLLIDFDPMNHLPMMLVISSLEVIIEYLGQYEQSKLHKTFEFNLEHLKMTMDNES